MEEHKPFHQPVSFHDTYEVDGAALLTEGGVAKITEGTPMSRGGFQGARGGAARPQYGLRGREIGFFEISRPQ